MSSIDTENNSYIIERRRNTQRVGIVVILNVMNLDT